eukprot:TRINITY_DN972_c0_g2_i1.p1 TRINITY_DN972_c0_g2~~TRINITY_DN972_c0_g2_i1.p1  ORF type:complete len:428 (+),score=76.39 TRINITY_DN972_c0_g2_i1:57-1340(+)
MPMTIEDALDDIGWGMYGSMLLLWGSIGQVIAGMHTMSGFFTTLPWEVRCREGIVCTGAPTLDDFCTNQTGYDTTWELGGGPYTVLTEWGPCEDTWRRPLAGSLYFVGWFMGGVVLGDLSAKYGRHKLAFAVVASALAVLALSSLSPSLAVFLTLRWANGVCIGGLTLLSYILVTESYAAKYQSAVATVILGAFAVGELILVPVAYWVPNWKTFSIIIAGIGVPAIFWYRYVEESPRWLAAVGREGDALVSLQKTASRNGKVLRSTVLTHTKEGPKEDVSLGTLFSEALSLRMTVMGYSWFACSLCYYGLNFAAGSLGGDLYVNAAIIAVIELPAYFMQYFAVEHPSLGRKGTMLWSFGIAGFACICYFVLYSMGLEPVGRALAFVGKFAITIGFSMAYIWGSELFPTSVRSLAMGCCTACARVDDD